MTRGTKKTPAYKRPSNEVIAAAIKGSAGIYATIAQRLGVARSTAFYWVSQDPELAKAREDDRESIVDLAESKIFEAVQNGDTKMAVHVVSTIGKNRGWAMRVETTGKDGGPIEQIEQNIGTENLSEEEQFQLYELMEKARGDSKE